MIFKPLFPFPLLLFTKDYQQNIIERRAESKNQS